MKSLKMSAISLLTALAFVGLGERSSLANEPVDNTLPGGTVNYYGNPSVFTCSTSSCGFGGGSYGGSLLEISSASDVDHLVVTCGNGIVTAVQISIASGGGDLDLDVHKLNTAYYGASRGTGSTETVYTSGANMNALVAKIYGYAGATGGYQLAIYCSA